jgi:hypothetical protein
MNQKRPSFRIIIGLVLFLMIGVTSISACTTINSLFSKTTQTILPKAEVVFRVNVPAPLKPNEKLFLEIVDDVTGLFFNSVRYEMTINSDSTYLVRIPLTINADIRYRYLRVSDNVIVESIPSGKPVRYRLVNISGPLLVQDSVAGWVDTPYSSSIGRIRGQVIDRSNNAPIPNLLINVAGVQTTTSSDGTFVMENVPLGTHNLVIMSKDSLYVPFQQYAQVAAESTTPVFVFLDKRITTRVTFNVTLPKGFSTDLPLRVVGNNSTLGNPFAELSSGSTNIASSLPIMTKETPQKYSLTVDLPVGAHIVYKYTLGDGFWNSELNDSGGFVLREFIVPNTATTKSETVKTFYSPELGRIDFNISAPSNIGQIENVSIQFNPFGWLEPIPMVKGTGNDWTFSLYSPLQLVGTVQYRFCRNGDCNLGESLPLQESSFIAKNEIQEINAILPGWKNIINYSEGVSRIETGNYSILPRPEMITGFEIDKMLPKSWESSFYQGLEQVTNTGANWVLLSPTWSITSVNPPMFEPVSPADLDWVELQRMTNYLTSQNLIPAYFPQVNFSEYFENFWESGRKDTGWWITLYERYERFILDNVDLAVLMNVNAIIIGDPTMSPSMQNGMLSNSDSSMSPEDADARWSQLIQDIRARYTGKIIGVLAVPSNNIMPSWLSEVDMIYVLFSPGISNPNDILTDINQSLESNVAPIYEVYKKPILIGINYPSSSLANDGCVDTNGSCMTGSPKQGEIDLDSQAKIYNAILVTSFSKPWITGVFSRNYYPYLITQDTTSSVYGKPAMDILWFWYHFILNKT